MTGPAYKKQDATQLTLEEIKCVLLTTDGRGEVFKEKALRELFERLGCNWEE